MADANPIASPASDGIVEAEDQHEKTESAEEDASFELDSDMSDDEVSLLEVDDSELSSAMKEAGISFKVLPVCVPVQYSTLVRYGRDSICETNRTQTTEYCTDFCLNQDHRWEGLMTRHALK